MPSTSVPSLLVLSLVLFISISVKSEVGFSFASFDSSSQQDFHFVLNAALEPPVVRLTTASATPKEQVGAMWYTARKFHVAEFTTTFELRMSDLNPTENGNRDGIAFVIQNEKESAAGPSLGGMGYGDEQVDQSAGIRFSLAIEFDTYMDTSLGDPNSNHVSVHTKGTGANSAFESASIKLLTPAGVQFSNHTQKIAVTYLEGALKVFFYENPTQYLEVPIDITTSLGLNEGEGDAWIGFTSSSSGLGEDHDVVSWDFTYLGNTNASKCIAYGPGIQTVTAGQIGVFWIQAIDQFGYNITYGGEVFDVQMISPSSQIVNVTTLDNENGTYTVTYTVIEAGDYSTEISFNGTEIMGSPFGVTIMPGPVNASFCEATGNGLASGIAGEERSVSIAARDQYGNLVTQSTTDTFVLSSNSSADVPTQDSASEGGGMYSITYNVTKASSYLIAIELGAQGGTPIAGSPWEFGVSPAQVSAQNCIASGEGLTGGDVENLHSFTIYPRDQFGNNITTGVSPHQFQVEISGTDLPTFSGVVSETTVNGSIVYLVVYNVTKSATYTMSVTLDGTEPIAQSPFTVVMVAGHDAYAPNCIAYGPGLDGNVTAGKPGEFTIQPRDFYGNNMTLSNETFEVRLRSIDDVTVIEGTILGEDSDGRYRGEYIATRSTGYYVNISLNGVQIDHPHGPYYTLITPAPIYAPLCFATGNGLGDIDFDEGETHTFTVYSRDYYNNVITQGGANVTCTLKDHMEDNLVKATVDYTENGQYRVTYTVDDAGYYVMKVQVDGENIANSPFFIQVNWTGFPVAGIIIIVASCVGVVAIVAFLGLLVWRYVVYRRRRNYVEI